MSTQQTACEGELDLPKELLALLEHLTARNEPVKDIDAKMTAGAIAGVHIDAVKRVGHMLLEHDRFAWWSDLYLEDKELTKLEEALEKGEYLDVLVWASLLYSKEIMRNQQDQDLRDEECQQVTMELAEQVAQEEAQQDEDKI